MLERACSFGRETRKNLMGVLTLPIGDKRREVALIFVNAGVLHRVGPYRLYVELARRLASVGFATLRFDLSGLGDSELPVDDLNELERAVVDVQAAMDYLQQQYSFDRFVLLGLCSGADDALSSAVADARVVGAVLLDGFGFRTAGFYRRHYLARALQPKKVLAFLSRQVKNATSLAALKALQHPGKGAASAGSPAGAALDIFDRQFPPASVVAGHLSRLAKRGAKLLFIYSGGSGYFNHERQFAEMFPAPELAQCADVHFLGPADHTYTVLADRESLVCHIEAWLGRRFSELEVSQTPPSTRRRSHRSSAPPASSSKERIVF
ncbi:MAG: alpha/beta hydrolase [Polyangiaceae bacterium]|nr:alpha/beta hydrolase [Polyangiaceae bacterium]